MATYRGRKTDICRIVGFNIWGKAKYPKPNRMFPPGQHGPNKQQPRRSEYAEQLLAKQVIRRYYNVLEKQFRNTFDKAANMHGDTGLNFLRLLELRLATAVWRLGYARSIFQARQMVSHGHITVNGRTVNIPSFTLKVGDVVAVRDRESSRELARNNHYEAAAVPPYFDVDLHNMSGRVVGLPEREDLPSFFEIQKVVEFYAR